MSHRDITIQLHSFRIMLHVITHSYDIYLLIQMVGHLLCSVCTKDVMKDLASQVTIKVLRTSQNVIFLPCISSNVLFLAMFCIPQTEFLLYVYDDLMPSYAKPQTLPFVLH